ncbi:hypothetical protein EVAR_88894_1 [Eumeta japonica]|uniref:Uncharacterized protein n=1 Tax=Eumeta variegata TaxID=151549 RepID=A0A4C1XZ57_EUMVA|nr:hypothetical protein EVAR_88894_1 [Eumeta japonica]
MQYGTRRRTRIAKSVLSTRIFYLSAYSSPTGGGGEKCCLRSDDGETASGGGSVAKSVAYESEGSEFQAWR